MAESIEYNVGVHWAYPRGSKGVLYELFLERVHLGGLEQVEEVTFRQWG